MTTLPLPIFIETDPAKILAESVAFYESATGKILEPGQVERLVINTWAYREQLLRNAVQQAAMQNLIAFASFPILDYLAEIVGVRRLAASFAEVQIDFGIVPGSAALTIPAGLRVQSKDGKIVFQLIEPIEVPAVGISDPILIVSGTCVSQTAGAVGNDYAPGSIDIILDPYAYLASASNSTTSSGGSNEEADESLRERVKLAPSSFSVAGPTGAYKFFARSAHPSIIDVGVQSINPGQVIVYPLSTLGLPTPTPVLDAVEAALSPDDVRPLSDEVIVTSPTLINYYIEIELTLITGVDQTEVEAEVTAALQAYADEKGAKLGLDVVMSQIIKAAQIDGKVYTSALIAPGVDIEVDLNEIARPLSITVSTTGYKDA